jgi:hypothetical protein
MAMRRKPTAQMIETLRRIKAGANSWEVDQRTLRSLRHRGLVRYDAFEITPIGERLLESVQP